MNAETRQKNEIKQLNERIDKLEIENHILNQMNSELTVKSQLTTEKAEHLKRVLYVIHNASDSIKQLDSVCEDKQTLAAQVSYCRQFLKYIDDAPIDAYRKLKRYVDGCSEVWSREFNADFDDEKVISEIKGEYRRLVTQYVTDSEFLI